MNSYTYLAVSGQNTISLNSSNNTLNLAGTNGLSLTTNATTNTLTFATSGTIPNLSVNTGFTVSPSTPGTLDNVVIGATTPRAGTFSTLTITGDVVFAGTNSNITIAPTGNGILTIGPAQPGTINNMAIGGTTPSTGAFTALVASGAVSVTGSNASVNLSPTGTGTVTINPGTTGSINNMSIGATTPSTAVFTTVTMTSQPAGANSAVTNGYASTLAAIYGVALA